MGKIKQLWEDNTRTKEERQMVAIIIACGVPFLIMALIFYKVTFALLILGFCALVFVSPGIIAYLLIRKWINKGERY